MHYLHVDCGYGFLTISTVAQQAVLHQIWCFDTVWRISMFGYMTFF